MTTVTLWLVFCTTHQLTCVAQVHAICGCA